MKTYFFDMDGVLFNWDDKMTGPFETRPISQLGSHYFQTLKPNTQIRELVYLLIHQKNPVFVLSHSSNNPQLATEHLHDKQIGLAKQYPVLTAEQILWIPNQLVTKTDAVEIMLNRKITKEDILIDDYNGNLEEWVRMGGTAIKYLNGYNQRDTFDGIQLDRNINPAYAASILKAL